VRTMPIIAVYVDRSKSYILFELLKTLQKIHEGEIILDEKDQLETSQFILSKEGSKPFFKVKQDK
jgi:hypothetical protein